MKVQGETHYHDLEGGYYTLKSKEGILYKLEGGGPDLHKPRLQVEIEGILTEHGFGIGFAMPTLKVVSYRIFA